MNMGISNVSMMISYDMFHTTLDIPYFIYIFMYFYQLYFDTTKINQYLLDTLIVLNRDTTIIS